MKKYLFFITVIITMLLLVGCGNETSTTTHSPTTTPTVTPTVAPTTSPTVQPTAEPTPPPTSVYIDPAVVKDVKFEDLTVEYDTKSHMVEAQNLPESVYAVYENNSQTEIGEYIVSCKLYDKATNTFIKELKASLIVDKQQDKVFDIFLDEFFLLFLGNDIYSWNVFAKNPEYFGYERPQGYSPSWYSYYKMEDGDKELYYADYVMLLEELEKFDYDSLNMKQQQTYTTIELFLKNSMNYYGPDSIIDSLMETRYIDQFGGYVADFASCVTNYTFRNEQDLKDVISYINSTDEAFQTYVTYMSDKKEAGYPISDTTLTMMSEYLSSVKEAGTSYYLYNYMNSQIDKMEFLDDSQKSNYKTQVSDGLTNNFLVGVDSLIEAIPNYLGNKTDGGYLSTYGQAGKDLYKNLLEDRLGIEDINMDEYIRYLDDKLREYNTQMDDVIAKFRKLSANNQSLFESYIYGNFSFVKNAKTPEEMLEYLKKFSKTIVPDLKSNPQIEFYEMDETVQEYTNAMAYYVKSTIDAEAIERITLNPAALGSNRNEQITTIAHEGYPGHLYAYVVSKESGIHNLSVLMSNTGHAEGWAKYVELKLYEYMAKTATKDQAVIKLATEYLKINELLSYTLYTRIDAAINYEFCDLTRVASLLDGNGYNAEAAQSMYDMLAEIPTQYAAYGYGISKMNDLHIYAQKELGANYDEVDFNRIILSQGWVGFDQLEALVDNYIRIKKTLI